MSAIITTLCSILTLTVKVAVVAVLLLISRGLLWFLNMLLVSPLSDPLRHLPGPDGSALQNHFRDVMDPKLSANTHDDWTRRYGQTFRFHGFGKHDYRMMSFDFRVISHILSSAIYEKPWQTRTLLARYIGRGIFSMEGAEHKHQRRLIGPAFTTESIKSMTPVFVQKAKELCSKLDGLVHPVVNDGKYPLDPPPAYAPFPPPTEKLEGVTLDIAHWLSRASFDVIGLAGFNYAFDSLTDETEEMYQAYRCMFKVADQAPQLRSVLELFFPILRKLWPDEGTKIVNESLMVINKTGKELIAKKKKAIIEEKSCKHDIEGKDILSLLIKANLSDDVSKRLTDNELLDQCSTFLLAGSDSVSLAVSWCLHLLSHNPGVQTRLRDEILSLTTPTSTYDMSDSDIDIDIDTPNCKEERHRTPPPSYRSLAEDLSPKEHWEALEGLPYLDAVVRETLRVCPPVHGTIRVATKDDMIPVSAPVVLRDGTVISKNGYIRIRKGSYIHIPIEGLNLSKEVWGEDAREFDPERWSDLPTNARSPAHPGLGNVMTFGFGPHSCLGYKFSVAEIKIFLAQLLTQFVFKPVPNVEIVKYNAILTRPYVANEWKNGTRLPIIIEKYIR